MTAEEAGASVGTALVAGAGADAEVAGAVAAGADEVSAVEGVVLGSVAVCALDTRAWRRIESARSEVPPIARVRIIIEFETYLIEIMIRNRYMRYACLFVRVDAIIENA